MRISRAHQATAHVAGAGGHHPVREGLGRGGAHRVAGAAQLERADWLEVLELEPDLGRRLDGQPEEWGARDEAGKSPARRLDLPEGRRFQRRPGADHA
jgi:hypothetical protein